MSQVNSSNTPRGAGAINIGSFAQKFHTGNIDNVVKN
jgi:hypothetical protein